MKVIIKLVLIFVLVFDLSAQNWEKVPGVNPFVHNVFLPSGDPNKVIIASDSIPMNHQSQQPFQYFELLYGTGIQISNDGGRSFGISNWLDSVFVNTITESPESPNFWIMSFIEKGRMKIAYSTNGGENWTKGISNCDRSAKILNFAAYENRLIGGAIDANNGIFYSNDNFVTCGQNDTISVSVRDIRVSSANKIYIASDDRGNEGVYVSDDGGTTWRKDQAGIQDLRIHTVQEPAAYELVVLCGADQVDPFTKEVTGKGIYLSHNDGQTWQLQGAEGFPVYKIVSHPKYPLFVAAACGPGGVYVSNDGGVNWQPYNSGFPENGDVRYVAVPDLEKVDGGYLVYAGVYDNGLYRSVGIDPTLVSVENEKVNSLNVYPNPAKDFVDVYWNQDQNSNVTFQLFDLTGYQILSSEEFYQSGNNYKKINFPKTMNNGVYILQINSSDNVLTHKIIIQN